jgi:hypothetical protein
MENSGMWFHSSDKIAPSQTIQCDFGLRQSGKDDPVVCLCDGIPLTDDQVTLHQQIQTDTMNRILKSSNLIEMFEGSFRKLLCSM